MRRSWTVWVLAALTGVIGAVHLQQYLSFMSLIPWVGVLFLLNAAGATALMLMLVSRERIVVALAALGSASLALGALVSVVIAEESSFAGFHESSWRLPIIIAVIAEVLVLVLAPIVVIQVRRALSDPAPHSVAAESQAPAKS
jgi:hypothetical protein